MKFVLSSFIGVFLIIFSVSQGFADTPLSGIEKKYQEKNPELFGKYRQAVELINLPDRVDADLKSAIQYLTDILKADLNYAPAYLQYARLLMKSGRRNPEIMPYQYGPMYDPETLKNAETAIEQALKLEPSFADAYTFLGYLNFRRAYTKEARAALQRADQIGSQSPWLYLYHAAMLKEKRQWHAARLLYRTILNREIVDKSAYLHAMIEMAESYRYENDGRNAEKWYQQALAYQPTADSLIHYSWFLIVHVTDFEKAVQFAEQARSLSNSEITNFVLGTAYYARWAEVHRTVSEEEAKPLFDKAYAFNPEILTISSRLGKISNTRAVALVIGQKIDEMFAEYKRKKKGT